MSVKKTGYPEYILEYLRQRRGLKYDDKSLDDALNALPPKTAFSEVLEWHGMLAGLDARIKGWVEGIYGINLDDLAASEEPVAETEQADEPRIILAVFGSVWDGDTVIETACSVNVDTKEVFHIETAQASGLDVLDREYVAICGVECPVIPRSEADEDYDGYWYED